MGDAGGTSRTWLSHPGRGGPIRWRNFILFYVGDYDAAMAQPGVPDMGITPTGEGATDVVAFRFRKL